MGFHHIAHGEIYYDRTQVNGLSTHLISRKGIGYVPENQGIFMIDSRRDIRSC